MNKKPLGNLDATAKILAAGTLPVFKLLSGGFTNDQLLAVFGVAPVVSFVYEILSTFMEVVVIKKKLPEGLNTLLTLIASLVVGSLLSVQMFGGENLMALGLGVVTVSSLLYELPLRQMYSSMGLDSEQILEEMNTDRELG